MRRLLLSGIVLAAAAVALLVLLGPGEQLTTGTTAAPAARGATGGDHAEPAAAPGDVAALDELLSEIVARARRTGVLTPEEARRGYEAVRAVAPQLGRDVTRHRLLALGRSYRQLSYELALAPVQHELAELENRLAASSDTRTRAGLRQQYQLAARRLPEPQRYDALARLERYFAGG